MQPPATAPYAAGESTCSTQLRAIAHRLPSALHGGANNNKFFAPHRTGRGNLRSTFARSNTSSRQPAFTDFANSVGKGNWWHGWAVTCNLVKGVRGAGGGALRDYTAAVLVCAGGTSHDDTQSTCDHTQVCIKSSFGSDRLRKSSPPPPPPTSPPPPRRPKSSSA